MGISRLDPKKPKYAGAHGALWVALSFFAGLLVTEPVLADPAPAQPADAASGICEQIQAEKNQILHDSKWRMIWDLIRVKFAPASVVKPASEFFKTLPEQRLTLPGGGEPAGRNLIFSLEPPERMEYGPEVIQAQKRYFEISREIQSMRVPLKSFIEAGSVQQCVERVHASHFDFDHFSSISVEQSALQWVEQVRDGRVGNRLIGKTLPHLHLRWEVFRSTDLMTVFQALRSTQVRNVIIVAHSLSEGSLLDSAFNEYPSKFFSDLSPTLESISVYSCHGDKVAEHYRIMQALKATPTYRANRAVYFARGIKLMGITDVVPIDGVASFIKKVDGWAAWARAGEAAPVAPLHPYCAIEISGLQVSKGGYAFLLNNDFVGSVNPESASAASKPMLLQYPCALEDRPKNVLILKSLNLAMTSDIEAPERIEARFVRDSNRVALPAAVHYRHEDGRYQSSKWIWSRP